MNTPPLPACPKCGAALPVDAPKGLCPRCIAAMTLATETAFTGEDAAATEAPLSPAELAPHFPQFEIIEFLGRGGMGVVYKARQKSLNRVVALKLLAPERVTDAKFAERFTREAQALAQLNHPHIVTVYDFGQAGGFYFLTMEFVDGVNLRQAMRGRRFTPEQALAIVPPICDALQYAHQRGIVHRDIKPENLLLDKCGQVKIADFGVAKMVGVDFAAAGPADSAAFQQTAAGTPQYMAPEQKEKPQKADHRADIYSLGVVLYEMLTGELPADQLQPPSRKVRIDVRLDEVVLRALEKSPDLRWQTAADLRTQVETITESVPAETASYGKAPATARKRKLAVGIAALAIVIGAGITAAMLSEPVPSLSQARRRPAVAEQTAKEAALAQAVAEQEGRRQNERSATGPGSGSKRERFEPRAGMANQTSWGVFAKPSAFNPDGWAVTARMTLGGEAPVRLPGQDAEQCRITLIEGDDNQLTVAIREPARASTITLALRRDQPAEFIIDGRGYRILYPSVTVALDQPDTSPFAQVIVTPVVQMVRPGLMESGLMESGSAAPVIRVAPDAPVGSPRGVVNQWLAHVKAGRTEEMWNLTTRESGGPGSVELKNTWQFDKIKAYTLAHSDSLATVVTTRYKDNSGRERMIVFSLIHRDGRWLIRENAITTPEGAESRLEGFTAHPGVRYNVRREDIIGRWTEAFFSPAIFVFSADGGFSTSYRVVGGSRTNLQGTWRLEEDTLSYSTAAGATTGRVIRVREDFFQLELPKGNQSGFHRMDDGTNPDAAAKKPQARIEFKPVIELTIPTGATAKRFLTLEDGHLHASPPAAQPTVGFTQDAQGQLSIEFNGIHSLPLEKDEGIKRWDTMSAARLVEEYRQAGFALLPFERFSSFPIQESSFPLTFLLPGMGFFQVTEIVNDPESRVKVRYKLV